MMKIKNIEAALTMFEEATLKHAEATEQGDHITCNINYKIITNVIVYLDSKKQMLNLKHFFNHSSACVRMWSATYLLPLAEKESIKVLKEIANQTGINSLTAEKTLSEWRNGNLKEFLSLLYTSNLEDKENVMKYITIVYSISVFASVIFVVFLYFDLGHIPFYDDPDPKTLSYYWLVEIVINTGLLNILLNIVMLLFIGIYQIVKQIENHSSKPVIQYLIIYFIFFIYHLWFCKHIIFGTMD